MHEKGSNARCRRWTLLWIAVSCIAPPIAACLAYYVFKPVGGAVNKGALIKPQRPVPPHLTLLEEKGQERSKTPLQSLRGQWLMLSVDSSGCARHCVEKLYFMRQIRAAQGEARTRVLTVWVRTDDAPVSPALQQAYRGTRFLIADASARAILAQWLPTETGQTYTDAIYLIDPKGHLMMHFPIRLAPDAMQKDLSRLLKWSGSG
jgi:hypothetical protein